MKINNWMSTLSIASIVGIIVTSHTARGELVNMEQQDSNLQQENTTQTNEQIQDYWTPERMRNAKPLMPTVTNPATSKSLSDIQQGSNSVSSGADSEPIKSIEPLIQNP